MLWGVRQPSVSFLQNPTQIFPGDQGRLGPGVALSFRSPPCLVHSLRSQFVLPPPPFHTSAVTCLRNDQKGRDRVREIEGAERQILLISAVAGSGLVIIASGRTNSAARTLINNIYRR